jgi:mono/diheme cytochrome c family protein
VKAKVALAALPLVTFALLASSSVSSQTAPAAASPPPADGARMPARDTTYPTEQLPGENQAARNWFRLRCSTCHGVDGEGLAHNWPQTGPALKGNPFVINAPAAAIVRVIRRGRTGRQRLYHDTYPNMPAFGVEMLPHVDELVAFLKGDLQK